MLVEQDGAGTALSEMTTGSEAAIRLDEDEEEEDSDGVRIGAEDEFSPKDAH